MKRNAGRQKQAGQHANKRGKTKTVLVIVAALLALVVGTATAYHFYFEPVRSFDLRVVLSDASGDKLQEQFDADTANFVLLGFDRFEERDRIYRLYRPDTIIFASMNFTNGTIKVITIPRDTLVEIAHRPGKDKINHSYYYGHDLGQGTDSASRHAEGLRYTLDTVSWLMEAPIHFYITLDMDGVVEIVDLMGGVNYDVEVEIREGLGRGRVLLSPGYQHLDGEKFLHYIHFREVYAGTDQERIKRQQRILFSAFQQFKRSGKLTALPGVYKSLTENVETNLSFRQMVALVNFAQDVDGEEINFYHFSGEYQYDGRGVPYFVLDQARRAEVLGEILGIEATLRLQENIEGASL